MIILVESSPSNDFEFLSFDFPDPRVQYVITFCGIILLSLISWWVFSRSTKFRSRRIRQERDRPLRDIAIPRFRVDALRNDGQHRQAFIDWMSSEGFGIFTLDERAQQALANYWTTGKDWFHHQPIEEKQRWKGKPKYKPTDGIPVRSVNHGYVRVRDEKEYLKLAQSDIDSGGIPDTPTSLKDHFISILEAYQDIAKTCLRTLCEAQVQGSGVRYCEKPDLLNEVIKRTDDRSAIAFIHYFPLSKHQYLESERTKQALMEERQLRHSAGSSSTSPSSTSPSSPSPSTSSSSSKDKISIPVDKLDSFGMPVESEIGECHTPSNTHLDTGLLTTITSSDVHGLEVQDRFNNSWVRIEALANPKTELFVIIGRKLQLLASSPQASKMFPATVHRVALPFDVERFSMLYFQDIPQ